MSKCGAKDMKRSGWITGVTMMHLLLALVMAGASLLTLWLARSPEIRNGPEAADAIRGLKVSTIVVSIPAVAEWLAVWGLWKGKLWAWWLALLLDLGLAGVFVYSMIDDGWHHIDRDDLVLAGVFLALAVPLLLPAVRKGYWGMASSALPSIEVEKPHP